LGCGFWGAERGEWMVHRGGLCGSCVVIFCCRKMRQLLKIYFDRTERLTKA
jgi:hypothetical protein